MVCEMNKRYSPKYEAPKEGVPVIVYDDDFSGETEIKAVRKDYKQKPNVSCFKCKYSGKYWRFIDVNGIRIQPMDCREWSYL